MRIWEIFAFVSNDIIQTSLHMNPFGLVYPFPIQFFANICLQNICDPSYPKDHKGL